MEIKRDHYLEQLISKMHNGLVKVVTGMRRCGKSYLLFNIFKEHLISEGIDENHIIEISFDTFESKKFCDPNVLYPRLKESIKDEKMYYILLDEVQLLSDFEAVLNSLIRMKNVDEKIKPYVNDFKMNLFEIAYLEREAIDKFRSDFWILADYLYQMRVNNDYVACESVIKHVDELLMLMSAMTKDDRFEETINELSRKESVTMCEVLDKVEARGRKEGVISVLISLVKDGILSVSEAAIRADMSEESFKKYLES